MQTVRRSQDRGYADHGWLKSHHSFSFASYQDPQFVSWGNLRVINEDRVAPGSGFGTHGHRDMEIVSYVLSGALAHRDSLGHGAAILPGEVQRMSAGDGIRHSEYNHSTTETTHFLQIWFLPDAPGGAPGYAQQAFDPKDCDGRFRLLVSRDGREGSVSMEADACMWVARIDGSQAVTAALDATRLQYLHVVRGEVRANGQALTAGDALMLQDESHLDLRDAKQAEVLLFDLRP